jgi:hypothetical protein
MPRFVNRSDTQTIHADWWEPEEQVVIRKLSWGDRQRLMAEAASLQPLQVDGNNDGEEKKVTMAANFRIDLMQLTLLELGIASWTFTDENGPVPINRDTLSSLNEEDGDFISRAVDQFNKAMSRRERNHFRQETA